MEEQLAANSLNYEQLDKLIEADFESNLIKNLEDFVRIPNLSSSFDPENYTNGLQEKAIDFCIEWAQKQGIQGLKIERLNCENRTPFLFAEIDSFMIEKTEGPEDTVIMYGHLDKQPHMTEHWRQGLSPTEPVREGDKIYGRGIADDGYAFFSAILLVKFLQTLKIGHNKIALTFESDEESGSKDIMYYLNMLEEQKRIQNPRVFVCLDTACVDYDHMCLTASLRGYLMATIDVSISSEAVHSGDASGVIPDTFRILRQLYDRLEDPKTGRVNDLFQVNVPDDKYRTAFNMAKFMNEGLFTKYPTLPGVKTTTEDYLEAYLNRSWRAQVSTIGMDGLPNIQEGGNVLRTNTQTKISMRLPPTLDPKQAETDFLELFKDQIPYNAKVDVKVLRTGSGWCAPPYSPKLLACLERRASQAFGNPLLQNSSGGSIPFMSMMQNKFPKTNFIATGLLGPKSNAHGPNECLDVPMLRKLLKTLVLIVADLPEVLKQ